MLRNMGFLNSPDKIKQTMISISIRAQQLKSGSFSFVQTKQHVASCDLIIHVFLPDPQSLRFGIFLVKPTLPVLNSLSLKKLGSAYNLACPFFRDDFFLHLGYFNMFCRLILNQRMPKESLLFGMASEFLEIVRLPPKSTAISGRVQGM